MVAPKIVKSVGKRKTKMIEMVKNQKTTATKSWVLTLPDSAPLTLTLTPPPSWGYCFRCKTEKGLRIISKRSLTYEERKFCWSCALDNIYELEENYEFENKSEVIKELRRALNS